LITILRFPLLLAVVLLLYLGGSGGQLAAASLIVLLILMDMLDGVVARRRGEETLIGGALDIAADRAVEIVLWVTYAHLGLIPVAVPLIVVIRGALVDSIRNIALQHGLSAHSMMRSSWGKWLVASPLMRTPYAVTKAFAFALLALALGFRTAGRASWRPMWVAALTTTWAAMALCIARGVPVILEAPGLFGSSKFIQSAHARGKH
jgi:CDP-diacylglycerol--glycerol-3-phosphate 3-phosphatidyltransferase